MLRVGGGAITGPRWWQASRKTGLVGVCGTQTVAGVPRSLPINGADVRREALRQGRVWPRQGEVFGVYVLFQCCYKTNASYLLNKLNASSMTFGPWPGRDNLLLLLYGIHVSNTFLNTQLLHTVHI